MNFARLILCLLLCVTGARATTYNSDGSLADMISKRGSCVDGDTITIPTGTFTWTGAFTINTIGIKIVGQGSGHIVAQSITSLAVGTGAKTFTTTVSGANLTAGQAIRVERSGGVANFMTGTVTSYTGTTLVTSITGTGGSGTFHQWIISTNTLTTLIHSAGSAALFDLTEDTSDSIEISGIQFKTGTGTGDWISIDRATGGKPILVHDVWFRHTTSGTTDGIQTDSNQGVLWNASADSSPFSMQALVVHQKDCPTTAWTTASTMGTNDVLGNSNFYIEDCDFHWYLNATDFDDNAKAVLRHNTFDHCGNGTHGADTSQYGIRHFEYYFNRCEFTGYADGTTPNMNWWLYIRGGTFVIASNTIPDISSTDYGSKLEINCTVMNLERGGGPNGCWGQGVGGNQYPAPRQVGFGRVTGAAGNDSVTYVGDSEPGYSWGNTGTYAVGTSDYGTGNSGGCTGGGTDASANYIVAGRDTFDDGTVKPNWKGSTYPNPFRTDLAGGGGGGTQQDSQGAPGRPRGRRSP